MKISVRQHTVLLLVLMGGLIPSEQRDLLFLLVWCVKGSLLPAQGRHLVRCDPPAP